MKLAKKRFYECVKAPTNAWAWCPDRMSLDDIGDYSRAKFFGSPVDMERNALRDVVKGNAETLARKAHRFLTMATEYNARKRAHPLEFDGVGVYEKWLRSTGMTAKDARAAVALSRGKYRCEDADECIAEPVAFKIAA